MAAADQLSTVFRALADPTRRDMVMRLCEGDATVTELAEPYDISRATRIEGAAERYVEFAKASFPRGLRLDGLRIGVDAANGSASRTAPSVVWELGA